jgi:LPXTG-site transpeptidase (sortase) family protein
MYTAACLVLIVGAFIVVQGLLLNQSVQQQVRVLSTATATDSDNSNESATVPSEDKPPVDTLKNYRVAADLPRVISIPKVNETARVLQVGVDANNQLLTPKNIYDTAWYTGSSKPGEMGAAVIDGHYVGPTTQGVFSKLSQLKAGDEVKIERGDGTQLTFAVSSVETVPVGQVDMAKVLNSAQPTKPGLNLITCGGKYNEKTFEFSDRTIVYAVQV